jgi:small GTP-binding protein
MIQKKVCMIGAFATGKTSLVSRYVKGIYSDKYQTTVGVKIDKKTVEVDEELINIILWDIYGEDEFQKVKMSYLRGSSGYILVLDGTRRETLNIALNLQKKIEDTVGNIPFITIVNKIDLSNEWEINDDDISRLIENNWIVMKGSAKTGVGVENCFNDLAKKMIEV